MIRTFLKEVTGIKYLQDCKTEKDCEKYVKNNINFINNKRIKPNTIKIYAKNVFFTNEDKLLDQVLISCGSDKLISYQLSCEYFIEKFLKRFLKKNNTKLYNYFFENYKKYGILSKNIEIEEYVARYSSREPTYRVDMKIILPNKYEIIIEINEFAHEKEEKRRADLNRAREICHMDPKVLKFFILRQKYIKGRKDIKKFVKKILYPFIEEILYIEDEEKYMVEELTKLTCPEWKPICINMYHMFKNQNKAITRLSTQLDFFNIKNKKKCKKDFIKKIKNLVLQKEVLDDKNIQITDDCFSSDDDDNDSISSSDEKETESDSISNYYEVKNSDIFLTWKGFILLLDFILNYVDELYIYKQIFEFKFKLITKFMELLQKHRERTLKLREFFPIWGYYDSDYKF